MSCYKDKYHLMMQAAEVLHNENLYICVPHSAYYACHQLVMHIWYNKLGKTAGDISTVHTTNKEGTHEILDGAVSTYISTSNNKQAKLHCRDFSSKLKQLKRLRVRADYEEADISNQDSNSAIALAKDIHTLLRQYQ